MLLQQSHVILLHRFFEHAGLLLVLGMLAAESYSDVRRRTVMWRDRHYAAMGAAGLALFMLGGGWRDVAALFGMAAGITTALVLWRARGLPPGDCIILLVVSVTLPSYGGVHLIPVAVALLAVTAAAFLTVSYNLAMNTWQFLSHRCGSAGMPPLFAAYPRAGPLKRAFCLFAAHSKRPWEKFVVPVYEDGGGSFSIMRTTYFDRRDWDGVPVGALVLTCVPMNPLFLGALLIIAALVWSGAATPVTL